MQQEIQPEIINVDGYLIDSTTGEVVGMVEAEQFQVNDESSLNWVLSKMLQCEASISAVDTTEAVIHARAILDNAAKIKAEKEKRLTWLRARFEPDIHQYAAQILEGQKSRTHKTIYGSVSLRSVKGGLRVSDPAKALEWAKIYAPEAVKVTESFGISLLPEEKRKTLSDPLSNATATVDALRGAFEVVPDRENVTIKTGV